jgi:hypothetical protein
MAKNANTQAKPKATQTKPNIVTFNEFLKLKGAQKGPLTIYFDEQRWKSLTKGIKPVEGKAPKKGKGIHLALFTSPLMPGGFGTLSCLPPGAGFSSGPSSTLFLAGGGLVNCQNPTDVDIDPDDIPDTDGGFDPGLTDTSVLECGQSINFTSGEARCGGVCGDDRPNCSTVWHSAKIGLFWHVWLTCECRP